LRAGKEAGVPEQQDLPIQPVEKPILCNPYAEPNDHWIYDRDTGKASRAGFRRPAGYWYKTERTGAQQLQLLAEEERDDLPLVNLLREDVRRWREADYRGSSNVTKELLRWWARADHARRLFFCQREAVETIIYLAEIRIAGKSSRTGFHRFSLSEEDLKQLLRGERPSFQGVGDFFATLADRPYGPGGENLLPLRRLGCKMATGSGKTVVMAMLIAWAFCNRGQNPQSKEYPSGVLVCCPNLTVKERLQVLRPENPENYYTAFDLVPVKFRPLMQCGKVLVENWHQLAPESEHKEGDRSYAVVNKGPHTPESYARQVLGDLYERMPVMVLNDEGHHCWRPAPVPEAEVEAEEREELKREVQEATVWIEGLDELNNSLPGDHQGILMCVDLSATPFYIKGSGHPEGWPFPWLVSDFGLVDAIESGIVKIPRLPVLDTTGRPDPKYFKLWQWIRDGLQPGEFQPGKARRPKPEVVYREAEGALQQIAGQWVERFKYIQAATPGQARIPPVLIIVCDNTDIAEVFYRNISGETEEEAVTEAEADEVLGDNGEEAEPPARKGRSKRPKKRTVYGTGSVYAAYFSNMAAEKRTIRIDTKLLEEAESEDPNKRKSDLAEELRKVVATVGKVGQPGEHVRCVVSVGMLTEGWDANNVTHVLGVRAFGSQLLCEQVVGRGLRRMNYTPDPETGLLTEEYVDVYGIPFSVIPFKGRPVAKPEPDDKPKNHVRALPERAEMEMRFPVVEGYVFALQHNLIRCDLDSIEPLIVEPNREPTDTFLTPTLGYHEGHAAEKAGPSQFVHQNRDEYYRQTHLQAIEFLIAKEIVSQLTQDGQPGSDARRRVLRLQSRHQLFPQVYRIVREYVERKVNFQGEDPCELGLKTYVERIVERLRDRIEPDAEHGEPPLLPVLHRYKPIGTTAEVDFITVRSCHMTMRSHINQVVVDTATWESTAAFRLEQTDAVQFYARNDHLGLLILYEYLGVDHTYEPDFIVRLTNGVTVVLEIKGYEDDLAKARHNAARKWVSAVNNWGQLGAWYFHVCRNPQVLDKELAYILTECGTRKTAGLSG
jgi:type III restriction enzyme